MVDKNPTGYPRKNAALPSMDYVVKSPAQQLKVKAQLSLSPKLSSKLNPEAQVRLSSVVH